MKILVLTFGDESVASTRTRVFQYLPHLEKVGIVLNIVILTKGSDSKNIFVIKLIKLYRLLCFIIQSFSYKIIFVQKVLLHPIIIKYLTILNKKIIFDFDDAIYTTPDYNLDIISKKLLTKSETYFKNIILNSDLVVLENENTKNYVTSMCDNILLITGPIDTDRYIPVKEKENISFTTIGWIGSPSTTPFLEDIANVFSLLTAKYPKLLIKLIGADTNILSFKEEKWLKSVKWNLDTEIKELNDFDIGIMPLPNDEWSQGKGGYKILQYMALGIPSIASPIGINSTLIEDGKNGYLVQTSEEWVNKLSLLIENQELRKLIGIKGREMAVQQYSFYTSSERLIAEIKKL